MLGAIIGDIIGSPHEFKFNIAEADLFNPSCKFTDDTILTLALAETILQNGYELKENNFHEQVYQTKLRDFYNLYPDGGYGGMFRKWAKTSTYRAYYSCGNGALMRISPVLHLPIPLDHKLSLAVDYTNATHNHPASVIAVSCMVSIAHTLTPCTSFEQDIKIINSIYDKAEVFGYKIPKMKDIAGGKVFDKTCQTTLPKALACVVEANCFADVLKNAISIGGDIDTIACIAGALAEFVFPIPQDMKDFALVRLDNRLSNIYRDFSLKFKD